MVGVATFTPWRTRRSAKGLRCESFCTPSGRPFRNFEPHFLASPALGIRQGGFTVTEMLAVLAIIGILLSTAVSNLKELDRPLQNGVAQTLGFFRQVRSKAVSSTVAYTISPASDSKLVTKYGINCSDESTTEDETLELNLPKGVAFTETDWSLCFNSRGFVEENLSITLIKEIVGEESQTRTLQVYLGGAVKEE